MQTYIESMETLAQVSDSVHKRKHGSYRLSTPFDIHMHCYMQLNKEANIHINRTKLCRNKLLFRANNHITFPSAGKKTVKDGCDVLLI